MNMNIGDLVYVASNHDVSSNGIGIYLGRANRNDRGWAGGTTHIAMFWKGRIATFADDFWHFKVISRV